ncbi:hypothetical protein ACFYY1_35785 [Streptomyces sp. NPDC001890]|uniref:hypothetical protein n=1 Tax=Streptomyces sp. NPDC001890 TaxID=3364620 RepID=UPI003678D03B
MPLDTFLDRIAGSAVDESVTSTPLWQSVEAAQEMAPRARASPYSGWSPSSARRACRRTSCSATEH